MAENVSKLKNVKLVVPKMFVSILVILLPLLVDQLNGFLQKELGINFSISQVVKFGYIIFFFLLIFLYSSKTRMTLIIIGVILGFPLLSNIFSHKMIFSSFFGDLVFIFKLMTFPIFFMFFFEYGKNFSYLISSKLIDVSIKIIFYMVFFALVLSIFGFGQPMYTEGEGINIGYKGYFIAGNEISSLFIVIYSFYLFTVIRTKNVVRILVVMLVALICSVLMTTKTTLISFVIVSTAIPLLNYIYDGGTIVGLIKRNLSLIGMMFVTLTLSIIGIYFIFQENIEKYIDKLKYAYGKAGTIVTFLLSARDQRYQDSFDLFNNYSFTEKMFGTGWTYPQHYIGKRLFGFGHAETDWLDLLVSHGYLGVIIIYSIWIFVLILTYRSYRQKRSFYSTPSLIAVSLLIINTTFSGHIVYSAMIGMYLAYFVSGQFIAGDKK